MSLKRRRSIVRRRIISSLSKFAFSVRILFYFYFLYLYFVYFTLISHRKNSHHLVVVISLSWPDFPTIFPEGNVLRRFPISTDPIYSSNLVIDYFCFAFFFHPFLYFTHSPLGLSSSSSFHFLFFSPITLSLFLNGRLY